MRRSPRYPILLEQEDKAGRWLWVGWVMLAVVIGLFVETFWSAADGRAKSEAYETLLGEYHGGRYIVYGQAACPVALWTSVAPEVLERPEFLQRVKRVYKAGGDFKVGVGAVMRTDCLISRYSQSDLKKWSERGDPVGSFLLAYSNTLHDKSVCTRSSENTTLLKRALQAKADIADNHSQILRVPEAYAGLATIAEVCDKNFQHTYFSRIGDETFFATLPGEE